jgi:adenylate cyclase class 2
MGAAVEREVKLQFESPAAAREAVLAAGAAPVKGRRLQEDCLLDTAAGALRDRRSALRVRMESGRALLTFKGPVQPSLVKVREELETIVADGAVLLRLLEELGFHVWFRYEKYREEFALDDAIIAIDETPVGTFIEIEGSDRGIESAARALGRGPSDYLLDSYRGLFLRECERRGITPSDMLFETSDRPA